MKEIKYFTASWCQPCKMLGPIMEGLRGEINYTKIDVDENRDQAIRYMVRSVPSLILEKDGQVKDIMVGVRSREDILRFYNQ